MLRLCISAAVALAVASASGVRHGHPQPMDDVLADNYHVKYNLKADALELVPGEHPDKALKVEEQQNKRSLEEKEKVERVAAEKAKVAKEQAFKKFWADKADQMRQKALGATEEGKKMLFKIAEKKKAALDRKKAAEAKMDAVKKAVEKATEVRDEAKKALGAASDARAAAQNALNQNAAANLKDALKAKVNKAADDEGKAKGRLEAAEGDLEKAKADLANLKAEEKKDAEEADKADKDTAAEEKGAKKTAEQAKKNLNDVEKAEAEEKANDPKHVDGKVVVLQTRSKNPGLKGKFFSSCPGEDGKTEWLDKPDPTRGFKVVVAPGSGDKDGYLRSGKSIVYLQRWCDFKADKDKPQFLLSSMDEDGGFKWGTDGKNARLAWKLEFGDEGEGEILNLANKDKDYIRDAPAWKFVRVKDVAIQGLQRRVYLQGNAEENKGMSWGQKKDSNTNWNLLVLKEKKHAAPEADGPMDDEDMVKDKTIDQGGSCTVDKQCKGAGKKQGFCRKCGKCQESLGKANPCGAD